MLVFSLLLFQSCTVTRIAAFFQPAVTDYKIFPCDTVFAAKHSNPAFIQAPKERLPDVSLWVPPFILNGATNIDEFLKLTYSTSLLVLHNDTLFFERYANKHKKEDFQIVFSVTKGITAMLAAIAVEEGILRYDQKVSDFIPEFATDGRREIEIKHLLNMVSGIDFNDRSNFARLAMLYYNNNQDKFAREYNYVSHKPGTHFAYQSLSTQILAICLEKASNKKLKVYLQEKIWEPLGMEYDALYTLDSRKNGNIRAFGGLAIRSRDMVRIGKLLLNKGVWEGKQILPVSFVDELMNRQMRDDRWWGYQSFFWRDGYVNTEFLCDTDFFAAGHHGQFIYVNPENNIVIVRQGKKETFRWPMLFGRLVGAMTNKGNDVMDECRDYSDQFEGIYESNNGEKYEIVYRGVSSKTGADQWVVFKDVNQTLKTRKLFIATKFDGRSIGTNRLMFISRSLFDIQDNKIVGMFHDNQRAVDMRYFVKKGDIPLQMRKQILAGMKRANDRKVKMHK